MRRPKICAVIVEGDLAVVRKAEETADLLELRIDLIGDGWQEIIGQLRKPWIACNRVAEEGGKWKGNEATRIEQLLLAVELGAEIIDIELRTKNIENIVKAIKKRAKCLISFHDLNKTPSLDEMKEIVDRQIKAGADICKVVTTATDFSDNVTTIQLIAEYPGLRLVSFAMGPLGGTSRVLCPLAGGDFTYASMERGKESAPGQVTVNELAQIYQIARVN